MSEEIVWDICNPSWKKNFVCKLNNKGLWRIEESRTGNTEHPTQKPIELISKLIRYSTKKGELVLDYFAGSCSTLKASKQEGRKWFGIEIIGELK